MARTCLLLLATVIVVESTWFNTEYTRDLVHPRYRYWVPPPNNNKVAGKDEVMAPIPKKAILPPKAKADLTAVAKPAETEKIEKVEEKTVEIMKDTEPEDPEEMRKMMEGLKQYKKKLQAAEDAKKAAAKKAKEEEEKKKYGGLTKAELEEKAKLYRELMIKAKMASLSLSSQSDEEKAKDMKKFKEILRADKEVEEQVIKVHKEVTEELRKKKLGKDEEQ